MALNMKTLTQALAKTAAVIEKTVTTTVNEVTGPRPLQDYDLLDQIGSGGPGLAWKLYSARPRGSAPSTQYPLVCVWVLDKRVLSEARTKTGLSKAAEDSFLEIVRADAAKLVRLRHPGVVHVVQALDESKNTMAMVTEPLFASVANALGNVENISKIPKELKGMEMSLLEIKHGLLQIAETLDFLHNNACLVHRSISPETVYITLSGAWKLGGFGFAVSIDQMSGDSNASSPFHYAEYDIEDSVLPLQPSLNYTAPELVRNKALSVGCSSDMFSCGCLAYHLVARKPLLDCHNNVKMYMNSLTYLSNETFSIISPDLTSDLRRMLSMDGDSRPSASDFTGSSFFRDDTRLRALRFLDHMLERDNMQKTEFLKALSDMWKDFDSRVLRYKVLPPLCAELRNVVMQPMILPMVLTIAESQEKNEFELSTLPALAPVLNSASGDTLLLLVKHSDLIINRASHEYLITHVLPLLVRAYDDTDARIQEEVLRRTVPLAKQLDTQLVKQAILPRVHSLALRTTIAAVRVNALRCLGDMVPSIDKHAVLEILQTLQRCTAVDRSAPTVMCTLSVVNSIFKKHGVEFTVEHVLPLLFPLLTAQQLNVQQFAKYMLFVKDILRMIEEKRGVTLTDYENSEGRIPPSVPNRLQSAQVPQTTTSAKSGSSWDEDWGPVKKDATISSVTLEPNFPSKEISSVTNPTQVTAFHVQSAPLAEQAQPVCPPVDIEWPPQNPSASFGSQLGGVKNKNQYSSGTPDVTFDDVDPFADWPPRPGNQGTSIGSGINNRSSLGVSGLNVVNAPSLNNRNSVGQQSQYQDDFFNISKSNGSLLNPQRLSSDHGSSMIGDFTSLLNTGSLNQSKSNPNLHTAKRSDIGSIFTSANNEQTPLRIAPPPATAAGRGRGRLQGSLRLPPQSSQPSHAKAASEQRNLLDLL